MTRLSTRLLSTLTFTAVLSAPLIATAEVNQPLEIIDRPRVLPHKQLELRLDLGLSRRPVAMDHENVTGTTLGFGYGIADKVELRLDYGFGLSPSSDGKGPLLIAAGYSLLAAGPLTIAAKGGLGYDVGPGELTPMLLGVDVQFKLTEKFALASAGNQLRIGLAGETKPIGFDTPIALRYQAQPNVFAELGTNIFHIGIKDDDSGVFGSDFIPLSLGVVYSLSPRLDFGARLSDDLKAAGDTFAVGVFGRLFL